MSNNLKFDADGNVIFPYASFDAGVQDKWARLGGVAEAFKYMIRGVKSTVAHDKASKKIKAYEKEAKAFYKAHMEKNGSKSERELGRKPATT